MKTSPIRDISTPKQRFSTIPWITIQSTSYQIGLRKYDKSCKPRETHAEKSQRTPMNRYFNNSKVEFDPIETQILDDLQKEADKAASLSQLTHCRTRSGSFKTSSESSSTSPSRTKRPTTAPLLLPCDSLLSLPPENLSDDDEEETADLTASKKSFTPKSDCSITINDLRESVWSFCKDENKKPVKRATQEFDAELKEREAMPRLTTKIQEETAKASDLEDPKEALDTNRVAEKEVLETEKKTKKRMRFMYSAASYKQYLRNEGLSVPRYLKKAGLD